MQFGAQGMVGGRWVGTQFDHECSCAARKIPRPADENAGLRDDSIWGEEYLPQAAPTSRTRLGSRKRDIVLRAGIAAEECSILCSGGSRGAEPANGFRVLVSGGGG